MLFKISFYLLTLFFLTGNNIFLIRPSKAQVNNKLQTISIDYFKKKLPDFDYILGSGDQININVSKEYPELNQIAIIDGEGTINSEKLGRIYVKDLSVNELTNLLNQAYKKYVRYPSVVVQVLNYRPIKVMVEGEVANPGLVNLRGSLSYEKNNIPKDNDINQIFGKFTPTNFPSGLSNPMEMGNMYNDNPINYYFPTVFDAISQSGGITPFADLSNIKVIRNSNLANGRESITKVLNFEKVLDGDNSNNIRIYDSDIIRISKTTKENKNLFSKATISKLNPKYTDVFVFGRVINSGPIRVSREGVLTDAIDISGVKALKGPVKFIRINYDGTIDKRKFRFKANAKRGSYKNPLLKDGDLIIVGNSFFSSTSEILNEITSPFVGIYSAYSLLEAFQD